MLKLNTARKGWLTAEDGINAGSLKEAKRVYEKAIIMKAARILDFS